MRNRKWSLAIGFGNVDDDFNDHQREVGVLCEGRENSSGTDLVTMWQSILAADGYLTAEQVDGYFGPDTAAATAGWKENVGYRVRQPRRWWHGKLRARRGRQGQLQALRRDHRPGEGLAGGGECRGDMKVEIAHRSQRLQFGAYSFGVLQAKCPFEKDGRLVPRFGRVAGVLGVGENIPKVLKADRGPRVMGHCGVYCVGLMK